MWLRATPEDHWNRVVAQGDQRPMAENPHAFEELRALLAARRSSTRAPTGPSTRPSDRSARSWPRSWRTSAMEMAPLYRSWIGEFHAVS